MGKSLCHQAWGREINPWDPHGRKRELIHLSCPLTSTCCDVCTHISTHICAQAHSHKVNRSNFKRLSLKDKHVPWEEVSIMPRALNLLCLMCLVLFYTGWISKLTQGRGLGASSPYSGFGEAPKNSVCGGDHSPGDGYLSLKQQPWQDTKKTKWLWSGREGFPTIPRSRTCQVWCLLRVIFLTAWWCLSLCPHVLKWGGSSLWSLYEDASPLQKDCTLVIFSPLSLLISLPPS